MKRILFVTSLSGKTVNAFMLSSILAANKTGYEFHLAANFDDANKEIYRKQAKEMGFFIHHVPFNKNPLSPKNLNAKNVLIKLMSDIRFDIIHCNTPIGGLLGRQVAKKLKYQNVIYMAHGFHFYKGAPLKNWLFYYPVEKRLGKITDTLVTINKDDYELAKKRKMCKKIVFTHGVGIDTSRFEKVNNKEECRKLFNLPIDKKIVLTIGEMNKNKNQLTLLKATKMIDDDSIHFVICGNGNIKNKILSVIDKNNLNNNITLIEHVNYSDINKLYEASDVFWFASLREGLPSVTIEAMSASLPCIVSDIRGNRDLIVNDKGGYLVSPKDYLGFYKKLNELVNNENKMKEFGEFNHQRAKEYDINNSVEEISNIYLSYKLD